MKILQPENPAELLIHHAKIVTLDPQSRIFEAIAVRDGRIVALGSTASLLSEFSERVLRVKLEKGDLPAPLAAGAALEPTGWWRIPIADVAHVEGALRTMREAGVAVASLEVAEPELEEVFVKIMRREEARAR